jgi:hypothetical protein
MSLENGLKLLTLLTPPKELATTFLCLPHARTSRSTSTVDSILDIWDDTRRFGDCWMAASRRWDTRPFSGSS